MRGLVATEGQWQISQFNFFRRAKNTILCISIFKHSVSHITSLISGLEQHIKISLPVGLTRVRERVTSSYIVQCIFF